MSGPADLMHLQSALESGVGLDGLHGVELEDRRLACRAVDPAARASGLLADSVQLYTWPVFDVRDRLGRAFIPPAT
jgi:hypothetical protein